METEKRFNRMIGQLKGIQKMIVEKRNVTDVLQQISAVKKALDGLSKELVIENLDSYIFKSDTEKMKQIVERVINL
ncbi:MAG: metal-sensitive transcriptional regulator [Candidatus Roizmanbacteria bacterium]